MQPRKGLSLNFVSFLLHLEVVSWAALLKDLRDYVHSPFLAAWLKAIRDYVQSTALSWAAWLKDVRDHVQSSLSFSVF